MIEWKQLFIFLAVAGVALICLSMFLVNRDRRPYDHNYGFILMPGIIFFGLGANGLLILALRALWRAM